MEGLVKIMLGLNIIGFLYRLNCYLSIQYINIYPLLSIIYRESQHIIITCTILYMILKMIQIHYELLIIKKYIINNIYESTR